MDQYNQDEMTIDLAKVFENFLRSFKRMWKTVLLLVLIGMVALEMKEILFFNTTYTSEAVFVPSADIEDTYYYDFLHFPAPSLRGHKYITKLKSTKTIVCLSI